MGLNIGLVFAAFLTTIQPLAAVVWMKGPGGASCDTACQNRGGCNEEAWPSSAEEFEELLEAVPFSCKGIQEGGSEYDPSTDGNYCGWLAREEMSEPRCSTHGENDAYRFCPCNDDKEL